MTPTENKQTVEARAAGFRYWALADGNPKSTWLITRETARAVVAQADRAAELEREVTKWRGGYAPELEELEQVRDRTAELEAARDEAWFERVETILANGDKDYVVWCRRCGLHHQRPEHCPARTTALAEDGGWGMDESEEERAERIRQRADEARPNVSMTPGQAETLRRARAGDGGGA